MVGVALPFLWSISLLLFRRNLYDGEHLFSRVAILGKALGGIGMGYLLGGNKSLIHRMVSPARLIRESPCRCVCSMALLKANRPWFPLGIGKKEMPE